MKGGGGHSGAFIWGGQGLGGIEFTLLLCFFNALYSVHAVKMEKNSVC